MIAPLRRAHRRMWVAVTVLLVVVIAAALSSRTGSLPWNNVHWEDLR